MTTAILSKACTKCGEAKEPAEFSRDEQKRDGLASHCKSCRSASSKAYCVANSEKEKARGRVYRAANPDSAKARQLSWVAANPEKVKATYNKWRDANPAKVKAGTAAYRAANRDKLKASRVTRGDRINAYRAAWRAANPDAARIHAHNRNAKKRENGGTLSKGLSIKLFKLQRGMCPCCKQPLGDDFHMDHIQPIALGGSNTDDNIQLLRQRCNNQKSAAHPVDFMQSRGFLI